MSPISVKIPVHNALRFLYALLCLLFIATIGFGVFYLCTGYEHLVHWYYGLNGCFYNANTWIKKFYTPAIWSDGRMYSGIAIAVSLSGLYYIRRKLRRNKGQVLQPLLLQIEVLDMLLACAAVIVAFCLWWKGNKEALPAYDEIFSAQNIAGIHPFQTVSYYMLPNNHIFFNLLNNVLFHWAKDKVVTGRVISLFAYEGIIVSLFLWLKHVTKNRWFAFITACILSFQWIVWGFSYQARGYELYLLAEWGMLISLICYMQSFRKRWMYINVLCCTVGYFCIPSFMYFHIPQLLFGAFYFLFKRKGATAFWKAQLATIQLCFLLYTPLLCFSGLDAIIKNRYVNPMDKHLNNFVEWAALIMTDYINHIFSITKFNGNNKVYLLLLLPLPTLFAVKKNRLLFLTGCFYFTSWVVFFLLTWLMLRIPFERNLTGNYSMTLMIVLVMIYWVLGLISKSAIGKIIQWGGIVAALCICIHSTLHKKDFLLKYNLYEYPVNDTYTDIEKQLIDSIPAGSSVGFCYEDFYCRYICMQHGYTVTNSNCPSGTEDYFVKKQEEALPIGGKYILTGHSNEYEIYKRQPATTDTLKKN